LSEAEAISKTLDIIFLNKGLISYLQGDQDTSIHLIQKSLSLNPQNPLANLTMGDLCFADKDIPSARKYWEIAKAYHPLFFLIKRRYQYLNRHSMGFSDWLYDSSISNQQEEPLPTQGTLFG
ncbi:MAG: hypothetical protein HRT90_03480, partial [Candidatus Margulisbacteria bacterium]|nr:hypothetical protein [Candidatus Margulisiibacteriota bacterium]